MHILDPASLQPGSDLQALICPELQGFGDIASDDSGSDDTEPPEFRATAASTVMYMIDVHSAKNDDNKTQPGNDSSTVSNNSTEVGFDVVGSNGLDSNGSVVVEIPESVVSGPRDEPL